MTCLAGVGIRIAVRCMSPKQLVVEAQQRILLNISCVGLEEFEPLPLP